MRRTLADVKASRLPRAVGICSTDTSRVAEFVNEAQERLINAGGETGWWGGWARVVFSVSRADPYITLPRQFARLIGMVACQTPMRLNNEFYEMLPAGPGLMPTTITPDFCGGLAGYERGSFAAQRDIDSADQLVRLYLTDARDVGQRILITGLDQNSVPIYSVDGTDKVDGFYLTLAQPFVTSGFVVSSITGIQKPVTYGDVVLKQVDQTTGDEVTLSRYGASEIRPSYRRYFLTALPTNCCDTAGGSTVSITAIAKYEFVPVAVDEDFLLIGNIPALIEEAMAIRYSDMDVANAAVMSARHHAAAIRQLQNELRHYQGEQRPAVSVDIFQGAPLEHRAIGTLI